MYREMRAVGVLLPSMLWPWLGEERGNLGRIKKPRETSLGCKELPPSWDKLQEMEKRNRSPARMGKGTNEAMRAAETHCERAGKS